jgi:hypothetical protein
MVREKRAELIEIILGAVLFATAMGTILRSCNSWAKVGHLQGGATLRKTLILAAIAAFAFTSAASAKSCKDASGHFAKCPAAAAPAKAAPAAKAAAARCKDAKGKYIACAAPAAAPAAKPAMSMFAKPARPAPMMAAKASTPRTGEPKCKTGVPCGKSCIPKGKVCHKN